VALNQNQFDALLDFVYNVGYSGMKNVVTTLNTGDYEGAVNRMLLYNKSYDAKSNSLVVNPVLAKRRADEKAQFETK
jgi:lysozyme